MHTLGLVYADSNKTLTIDMPLGTREIPSQVCSGGMLHIDGYQFSCDLALLDMRFLDIILGIDWLSLHGAIIDCEKKQISLYPEPNIVVTF